MAFPSVLNTFPRPATTDKLNSPSHSGLHNTVSSALGQIEATIGITGANSVVGTMMYDLRSPASGGGGHVQAVNKGGTGQTSYTKGDILVAQSASVLTKLSLGGDGTALIADSGTNVGLRYGAVGVITASVFTGTTGTWFKPAGATTIMVEMWGGGGSGGSYSGNGAGIGGGGGAYINATYPASIIANAVSVIAGASTLGVTGNSNGTVGNNSQFGTYLSSAGGAAGIGTNANSPGANGGINISMPSTFGIYGYGGSVMGWGQATPGNALYSSGSGAVTTIGTNGNSGNTIYGGGAGATVQSFTSAGSRNAGTAGTSSNGGNGGQSSIVSNSILGVSGITPGGGGGGTVGATSGNGAEGQVIIYTW